MKNNAIINGLERPKSSEGSFSTNDEWINSSDFDQHKVKTTSPVGASNGEITKDALGAQNEDQEISESDGGRGWVIVFGCVLLRIILGGIVRSSPLFYVKFLDKFGGTAAQTAWVTSLGATIRLLVGPVVSVLCNRFSCRKLVFVGAILYVGAVHVSGYASDLTFLYFSYGVLGGIGRAFLLTPCTILLSLYFNKNASLAFGVASSGFGIGGFVVTPVIEIMFQSYGFHGTFLLLIGVACHLFVCVTLFKSTRKQMSEKVVEPDENEHLSDDEGVSDSESILLYQMCSTGSLHLTNTHVQELESMELSNVRGRKSSMYSLLQNTKESFKVSLETTKRRKWISFSILKDVRFITLCLATFLFSVPSSGVFLAALAGERGLSDIESAYLISISAGCDTVIRIISGFVLDLDSIRTFRPLIYNITSFLQGVSFFLIPLSKTFWHFAILCGFRGMLNGLKAAQKSVVLLDILGVENLPSSFAYLLAIQGLGTLVGPPVSGFLKDHYGKYDYAFYFGGAAFLFGSLVLAYGNIRNCLLRQ